MRECRLPQPPPFSYSYLTSLISMTKIKYLYSIIRIIDINLTFILVMGNEFYNLVVGILSFVCGFTAVLFYIDIMLTQKNYET